ncbi:MAG: DUF2306 domain-containing protein [Pseudomonadota bacterium]
MQYAFVNNAQHAQTALNISAKTWFVLALVGQLAFAIYIGFRYGLALASGQPENMNLSMHITGYVEDDFAGNMMLYFHIAGAAILSTSGILQLVPSLRQRYPIFHRLNGRLFMIMGLAGALTGLYLTWLRGTRLDDLGAMGISINGVLIIVAIYLAWRYAIERKYAQHQRWAIHSFFLVNAVWTLRLFVMAWYMTTGGAGMTNTMDGPADFAISFGCYLLPMALAELYFWAKRQGRAKRKWAVFCTMTLGCLVTAIGVGGALAFMWFPRIITAINAL